MLPQKLSQILRLRNAISCVFRREFSVNKYEGKCNSWVARDVTKNQTKKLSILLSFYFHKVLQYLNTFAQTNFWFERVLRFAGEDA